MALPRQMGTAGTALITGGFDLIKNFKDNILGAFGPTAKGAVTTGIIGTGLLTADAALRGQNSMAAGIMGNMGAGGAAAESKTWWSGIKEALANFLTTIEDVFPKADFSELKSRLQKPIEREEKDGILTSAMKAIGNDPTGAVLLGLAAVPLGLGLGKSGFNMVKGWFGGGGGPGGNGGSGNTVLKTGGLNPTGSGTTVKTPTPAPTSTNTLGKMISGGNSGNTSNLMTLTRADLDTFKGADISRSVHMDFSGKPVNLGNVTADFLPVSKVSVNAIESSSEAVIKTTMNAAADVADDVGKMAFKKIPVIGGAITLGFSAWSAAGYAANGEFGRAGAELTAGTVEAAVNATGLGLIGASDIAREGVRAAFVGVAGEEWAPDKSGIRSMFEMATGSGDFSPQAVLPTAQVANVAVTAGASTPTAAFQTAALGEDAIFPDLSSAMGGAAPNPMAYFNPNTGGKGVSPIPANRKRTAPEYHAA